MSKNTQDSSESKCFPNQINFDGTNYLDTDHRLWRYYGIKLSGEQEIEYNMINFCLSDCDTFNDGKQPPKKKKEDDLNSIAILVVGVEKQEFHVKSSLLAKSSDYFKAMFDGPMKNDRKKELPDITPDAMAALLTFVHTGTLRLKNIEMAQDIRYAAMQFLMDTVKNHCNHYLLISTLFSKDPNSFHEKLGAIKDMDDGLREILFQELKGMPGDVVWKKKVFYKFCAEDIVTLFQQKNLRREVERIHLSVTKLVKLIKKWKILHPTVDIREEIIGKIFHQIDWTELDLDFYQNECIDKGIFTLRQEVEVTRSLLKHLSETTIKRECHCGNEIDIIVDMCRPCRKRGKCNSDPDELYCHFDEELGGERYTSSDESFSEMKESEKDD